MPSLLGGEKLVRNHGPFPYIQSEGCWKPLPDTQAVRVPAHSWWARKRRRHHACRGPPCSCFWFTVWVSARSRPPPTAPARRRRTPTRCRPCFATRSSSASSSCRAARAVAWTPTSTRPRAARGRCRSGSPSWTRWRPRAGRTASAPGSGSTPTTRCPACAATPSWSGPSSRATSWTTRSPRPTGERPCLSRPAQHDVGLWADIHDVCVQPETLGRPSWRVLRNLRVLPQDPADERQHPLHQSGVASRVSVHSVKLAISGNHMSQTNAGFSRKVDGTFYS